VVAEPAALCAGDGRVHGDLVRHDEQGRRRRRGGGEIFPGPHQAGQRGEGEKDLRGRGGLRGGEG